MESGGDAGLFLCRAGDRGRGGFTAECLAIGSVGGDVPVDLGFSVGHLAGLKLIPQSFNGGEELLGFGRTSLAFIVVVVVT